jgi:transcriptional regulator with XRE-family HTH domain
LGLTQKELAERLQIAEATLCRWETGRQIQQRLSDLALRLYFDLPGVRQYSEERLLATSSTS